MQKPRLTLVGLLLTLVLGLGFWLGSVGYQILGLRPSTRTYGTATLLQQVQPLAQLVAVKYIMEKVMIVEDVKWYGESRVLLVAHGIVKAGVDLGQIKPADVEITGKKVMLKLPAATLTDAYLDDNKTQVIERTTGLLRTFDKDMEQTARRSALDDIRRAARQNGILEEAEHRARLQLTFLLKQLGFEEIELKRR